MFLFVPWVRLVAFLLSITVTRQTLSSVTGDSYQSGFLSTCFDFRVLFNETRPRFIASLGRNARFALERAETSKVRNQRRSRLADYYHQVDTAFAEQWFADVYSIYNRPISITSRGPTILGSIRTTRFTNNAHSVVSTNSDRTRIDTVRTVVDCSMKRHSSFFQFILDTWSFPQIFTFEMNTPDIYDTPWTQSFRVLSLRWNEISCNLFPNYFVWNVLFLRRLDVRRNLSNCWSRLKCVRWLSEDSRARRK